MPYDTMVFRLIDGETSSQRHTVPLYIPSGNYSVTEMQAIANAFVPLIDAATDAKVDEIEVTFRLTVTGGKASAVAASSNERGGLISLSTAGPRNDSVRIPAIKRTIMSGNSFSTTATPILELVNFLTSAQTIAGVDPALRVVSQHDYAFNAAIGGSKSIRKR